MHALPPLSPSPLSFISLLSSSLLTSLHAVSPPSADSSATRVCKNTNLHSFNARFCQVDSNSLTTLPPSFGKLVALKSLALDLNQLGALPACVCELTALERLTLGATCSRMHARTPLRSSQFSSCSLRVALLAHLARTTDNNGSADNNILRFLHPRMSELQSLTLLSAANNRLTMLPASLATISCLRSLTLAGVSCSSGTCCLCARVCLRNCVRLGGKGGEKKFS
jgi:Leucine-rich repeat (LRR) protein